jgi:hypothetical protein
MKNERFMTDADRIEWQEIEASEKDNKARRARLLNRLRQRAHRERVDNA